MKLDKNLLDKCYYDTIITQYKNELEKDGFSVFAAYPFSNKQVDLYAEKDAEKRVYEFKMVGNQDKTKEKIMKFKDYAVSNGATPYVVYVNPPKEKQIQFDGLDNLLTNYFIKTEIPSELDRLSTHTSIESVEVYDLTSVEVSESMINIDGFATISAELQYSSNSDMKSNDGLLYTDRFPMSFNAKLRYFNEEYSIENIKYNIDISNWD